MKTRLLTSLVLLFSFYTAYSQQTISQQTIRPVVKAAGLDLYGFETLEDRISYYLEKGYVKSDFKGHPQEPKSFAYQLLNDMGTDMIYEFFYNDQKEVYKVSLYCGAGLGKWKTYTDEEKMNTNINGYFTLINMITDESGKPTVTKSYAWEPYNAEDLKAPARFLSGADAKKVGYFANWQNEDDYMHDSPIRIHTYNSRYVEISVADWQVQEAAWKAARQKE